jgi:hypothetical protein
LEFLPKSSEIFNGIKSASGGMGAGGEIVLPLKFWEI